MIKYNNSSSICTIVHKVFLKRILPTKKKYKVTGGDTGNRYIYDVQYVKLCKIINAGGKNHSCWVIGTREIVFTTHNVALPCSGFH